VETKLKRRLAIGAAGVAALATAGGTYAAARDTGDRDAYLNDVAERLNVSRSDLTKAMREAFYARLDRAVAQGRLSRDEANAVKERVRRHGGVPFPGGGPGHGPPGKRLFLAGGPFGGGIVAAGDYLGLSDAQLRERLRSGKSLAELARERGKSVDGLEDAIEKAVRGEIQDDKRIPDDVRKRMLERLDEHVDRIVSGKGPRRRLHRPHPGGPPGPPPFAP
jgi:hypothetical protein